MRRRSQCLAATALALPRSPMRWPSLMLAAPLALAPVGAGAATITIDGTCAPCNAATLLPQPGSAGDTIAFAGGTLIMNAVPDNLTYPQQATLTNNAANVIDQDSHTNTFTGAFANKGAANGQITITNSGTGGAVIFGGTNTYSGVTTSTAARLWNCRATEPLGRRS